MTIGVDFDGVIHKYSKGWNGGGVYDGPIDGAIAALEELMREQPVFIFTARDPMQVKDALKKWGVENVIAEKTPSRKFWNQRDLLLVTNHKYAARAYIDDRAIRFTAEGGWEKVLQELGLREPEENYRTPDESRLAAKIEALHKPVQYRRQMYCLHCSGHGPDDREFSFGSCDNVPAEWPCETVKLIHTAINK